jgi:ABC-type polysaccharide/polyol phosphate export permease
MFDMANGDTATALGKAEGDLTWWTLLWRTAHNWKKCFHWAWLDTVCQYRRSLIGPLWETINMAVMILCITVVSSAIFGGNNFTYIALGVIVWSVILSAVVDGSSTFIRNSSYITGTNFSIDLYVGRTVFKSAINFCHHAILYFVAVLFLPIYFGWISLLAIPGIILLFLNVYWAVVVFAFLSARFRDIELVLRSAVQLAFFVTPVFWDYRTIHADRKFIVDYNILFYYIEIIRAPLLGEIPPITHYAAVVVATALGYLLAFIVYRQMRRKLAFFV